MWVCMNIWDTPRIAIFDGENDEPFIGLGDTLSDKPTIAPLRPLENVGIDIPHLDKARIS